MAATISSMGTLLCSAFSPVTSLLHMLHPLVHIHDCFSADAGHDICALGFLADPAIP